MNQRVCGVFPLAMLIAAAAVPAGAQIMQLSPGARHWADSADGGPEDWGGRVQLTLLFPR